MAYLFEFDSKNRILRSRMTGRVTNDEIVEYYRAVPKYVALTDPLAAILDLSAVTVLDVSPEKVRELAKAEPAVSDPRRPRIVLAPSAQAYGLMRMFEMLGEQTRPNLHVVRDEAEVWAILGILEPHFDPLSN